MSNIHQKTIIGILNRSAMDNLYEKALTSSMSQYQLKPYNIMKLHPSKVFQIFRSVQRKFSQFNKNYQIQYWYQNQLRIFVWIVIVYAYLQQKTIQQMNQEDWNKMSLIFHDKTPVALQFQGLCLLRQKKIKKWTTQEVQLLDEVIREKIQKNHWNQIAKQFFIRSKKQFFRSPKQCRQQWLNHLDPTKTKQQWTIVQDYELIKSIIKNGRKWSKAAKELGNSRTEHMVKNRFKSLINTQKKRMLNVHEEQKLVIKIKQRLENNNVIKRHLSSQLQKNINQKQNNLNSLLDSSGEELLSQFSSENRAENNSGTMNFPTCEQLNFQFEMEDFQGTQSNQGTLEGEKIQRYQNIQQEYYDQWAIREQSQFKDEINLNAILVQSQNNFNIFKKDQIFFNQ